MAKLSSKGQITIPIEVRRKVGLKQGDEVRVRLRDDGTIELRPRRGSIDRIREILAYDGPSASVEDMDEAIAGGATDKWKPSIPTS